jgi:hypothetical protein
MMVFLVNKLFCFSIRSPKNETASTITGFNKTLVIHSIIMRYKTNNICLIQNNNNNKTVVIPSLI